MSGSELLKKLHEASFTLTSLLADPKYAHMKIPWEMVLGGLVLRAMIDEDKKALQGDKGLKELMERFTPEKVAAILEPAPKVVEKTVEKKVIVREPATAPAVKPRVQKKPGEKAEKIGGKYRRLKGAVNKGSNKERELELGDRNNIIAWWNKHQRLISKDDAECLGLANRCGGTPKLSPAQIAGCISQIARKAPMSPAHRDRNIQAAIKRGDFSLPPQYSDELIKRVNANYKAEREDEDVRRKAHQELHNKRNGAKTTTPKAAAPATPAAAPKAKTQPAQTPPTTGLGSGAVDIKYIFDK